MRYLINGENQQIFGIWSLKYFSYYDRRLISRLMELLTIEPQVTKVRKVFNKILQLEFGHYLKEPHPLTPLFN